MRRLFTSLASVAAVMALPAVAHAQLELQRDPGSLIPARPTTVDTERAEAINKRFARCVYRSARSKATALLENSDPQTVDFVGAKIENIHVELDMDICLGNEVGLDESNVEMRFSPSVLRSLLAEEAYLAANPAAPQLPTPVPVLQTRYVSTGDNLVRAQVVASFTDCAIVKDTVQADALLRTPRGSAAERAVATALAPALGSCLQAGQQVTLTPASIRAFVAYGMWNRFGRGAAQ